MIRQIWREIISGKNSDIYLGIFISLVVGLFGIFGVVDLKIVTAAILLTLSLIASSILHERWLREELLLKIFQQATWDDNEKEMKTRLAQATKVKFIAVSPIRILKRYKKELTRILQRKGGEIYFVVVNPKEGEAINLIKKGRPENYDDAGRFLDEICSSFCEYIKTGRLKVKLIDYIPSHIVSMIDEHKQDGVVFVTVYSFDQVDPYRPSMAITRREGLTYSFFKEEFKSLCEKEGTDYVCSEKRDEEGDSNVANTN
jgi:hypothetical protein